MDGVVSTAGALGAAFVGMTPTEAAGHAQRHFGVSGELQRFATEKDDTFRIKTADGRRYVLKIANPSEDPLEIDFQLGLLRHIEQVAPDLPVPRVITAVDHGAPSIRILDAAGQSRTMRLMSYLDGTPLDSTESTPRERECVGEMLGRLRHATAGYSHPAETRTLAWDVKNLPSLEHLLAQVDADRRRPLALGFERFCSFMPRISGLRAQVLHNDFSRSNIVVDHARESFVTGIIDFGDAVRTAVAIDVSTAVLNQLPRDLAQQARDDIFEAGRDVVRGYLRVADLSDEELDLVPHLAMGRVVARALITLWRGRLMPENATYILRNTEQGWAQLDWFLAHPPEEVSAIFRAGVF